MNRDHQMTKPFIVSAQVISAIRPMERRDIRRVAQLHHAAMGNSLWAQLGKNFLERIYRALIAHSSFLGFVYEEGDWIEGFIAGSEDTDNMMSEVFEQHFMSLGLAAGLGLFRQPTEALQIINKLRHTKSYFSQSNLDNIKIPAESLFCSFTPRTRGKRISGHINKVLFDTLAFRGHNYVKITTEQDNIGANRQLQSWGFEIQKEFVFYEKEMVTYVLDLQTSVRVEPHSHI